MREIGRHWSGRRRCWWCGCSLWDLGDLDAGVGNTGSASERGDWVGYFVLDEGEHVCGGLAQAVVGRCFGDGDLVGEPVDGECIANAAGAGDVAFVASAVFFGRANMPAVDSMWCHVGSLVWSDVC